MEAKQNIFVVKKNGKTVKLAGEKRPLLQNAYEFSVPIIAFGTMGEYYDNANSGLIGPPGAGYGGNLFMERLLNLTESSLHGSLIAFKQSLIIGDGLIYQENENLNRFLNEINDEYDANELIRRTALDLVMFGGFCWQVLWNATGTQVVGIKHVEFYKARWSQINDDYPRPSFWVSPNWKLYQSDNTVNRPQNFEMFNPKRVDVFSPQLYWQRRYTNMIDYYPLPDYYGALDYIELDIRLANFQLNNVKNGFVPTAIVSLPEMPSDEEQQKQVELIKQQYQGDSNAGELIVLFGADSGNAEGKLSYPEYTPVTTNNNADIYNSLSDIVQQRIISGHGLSSPTLAGLPGAGGLGGNASEINMAHRFFYESKIKDSQAFILAGLNKLLRFAGFADTVDLGYTPPIEEAYSENLIMKTMTINEIREERGLEPLPGGDVFPGQSLAAPQQPEVSDLNPVTDGF